MSKQPNPKAKAPKTQQEEMSLFPRLEDNSWIEEEEGQLAVDVQETDSQIIIRSAIAGVNPDDLDISVHNDLLTVRGRRQSEEERQEGRWLVRECHWGSFSRSLILPSEVDVEGIAAELKNGVLTVKLPKVKRERKIKVKEE
jgi:HSP20 family protein